MVEAAYNLVRLAKLVPLPEPAEPAIWEGSTARSHQRWRGRAGVGTSRSGSTAGNDVSHRLSPDTAVSNAVNEGEHFGDGDVEIDRDRASDFDFFGQSAS
jgi:hypothetical protein